MKKKLQSIDNAIIWGAIIRAPIIIFSNTFDGKINFGFEALIVDDCR